MQSRLTALKRLVALYEIVEEMHSAELQRLTAAVNETHAAIERQQDAIHSACLDSREALMTEDRMGWVSAETRRRSSGWKRRRLDQIHVERVALNDAAREQYIASRLKSEQMKRVVEGIESHLKIEWERRSQAASDDRFLSRRRWSDTRERMPVDQ
jgi:hypothetical protein